MQYLFEKLSWNFICKPKSSYPNFALFTPPQFYQLVSIRCLRLPPTSIQFWNRTYDFISKLILLCFFDCWCSVGKVPFFCVCPSIFLKYSRKIPCIWFFASAQIAIICIQNKLFSHFRFARGGVLNLELDRLTRNVYVV